VPYPLLLTLTTQKIIVTSKIHKALMHHYAKLCSRAELPAVLCIPLNEAAKCAKADHWTHKNQTRYLYDNNVLEECEYLRFREFLQSLFVAGLDTEVQKISCLELKNSKYNTVEKNQGCKLLCK
jgi:hypothetical protein